MKILVIFTCYNRKSATINCIRKLSRTSHKITFVIADDGSTDGTIETLENMKNEYQMHVLHGNGNWYYTGGMRAAMKYAIAQLRDEFDYLMIVNDDVDFFDYTIDKMILESQEHQGAIIVGVMCNDAGERTYCALKYTKGYKYEKIDHTRCNEQADTFMANGVMIPYEAFLKVGPMDSHYIHSLGDYDYGLMLKNAGYSIYTTKEFVGKCNGNSNKNTWTDTSLSRMQRIKLKETPKGAPAKQWYYFLKKNFGTFTAIKGMISPYIRIFLGK